MTHCRQLMTAGSAYKITCSRPMIVLVMSDQNLRTYNAGSGANYYGGFFVHFPAVIEVPTDGYWNLLLESRDFHVEKFTYSIDVVDENIMWLNYGAEHMEFVA